MNSPMMEGAAGHAPFVETKVRRQGGLTYDSSVPAPISRFWIHGHASINFQTAK